MAGPSIKACFCDICTCSGLRPRGSLQSATTAREHRRSQMIKDRLAQTLPDTHAATDFLGQLEPSSQDADSQGYPFGAILGADCRNNEIVDRIHRRVSSFRFPPRLVFAHPPTPHSTYVSDAGSWEQGPHALAIMAPENADILRHVQFLQRINRTLRPSVSDSATPRSATSGTLSSLLSSELSRMEAFRKNAWDDQLASLPSSSHRPHSGSGSAWQPIRYDVGRHLPTPCFMSPFNIGWLRNRTPHQR